MAGSPTNAFMWWSTLPAVTMPLAEMMILQRLLALSFFDSPTEETNWATPKASEHSVEDSL